MINRDYRTYDYFKLNSTLDEYGQKKLSTVKNGTIKMAIYLTGKSIQDNINYSEASYIGLTNDAIDDSYVIKYGNQKLKVLYIYNNSRVKQVFLGEYE